MLPALLLIDRLQIGGCRNGGYVNDASQDVPTYEFFPPRGSPVLSTILQNTLPVNLFPLTWLLPSGKLLIQSNWATSLLDYETSEETPLDNIPDAVRVYPASAGTIMLPLTPDNNYTATIIFCGGSDVQAKQYVYLRTTSVFPFTDLSLYLIRWTSPQFIIPTYPASSSCVKLTPDVSGTYVEEEALPAARSMANLIALPDGTILCLNGGGLGNEIFTSTIDYT